VEPKPVSAPLLHTASVSGGSTAAPATAAAPPPAPAPAKIANDVMKPLRGPASESKFCGSHEYAGTYCYYEVKASEYLLCTSRWGECAKREVPPSATSKLRFHQLSTVASGGATRLEVRFGVESGCSFGDVDALEMDLHYDSRSPLIASLESLDPAVMLPPISVAITQDELGKGVSKVFQLPAGTPAVPLGLFLCRDGAGRHKCMGKPSLNPTAVVVKDTAELGSGKSALPPDRIYYFQLAWWDGKGKLSLPDDHALADLPELAIPAQLRESGLSLPKSGLDLARPLYSQLRSSPLQTSGNHLTASLARRDRRMCR
jgi:hypothetical protein